MLEPSCSSKLAWGSYIVFIAQIASKKIATLICSIKFLSPEVALYLDNSAIRSCIECCCHFLTGADMLDELQKRICRTVGPSLAASLEPLAAHRRNVTSLVFSVDISLADVHLNWLNWLYFLILAAAPLFIVVGCVIFLSQFLDAIRMPMSTVFILAHLDPKISCLQNAFLWPMIENAI